MLGLIALSSVHLTHGNPIAEADVDEANQDQDTDKEKVTQIAEEQNYKSIEELIKAALGAASRSELETPNEFSPIAYHPDATTTLLNSVYEPIMYYPGSAIAENVYVERSPRDASQSDQGLQNANDISYAYGLTQLPNTEVLNTKACVEHHYCHLEPIMHAKPQIGCFINKGKYNKAADKVRQRDC